ncbi:nucleotide kinase domain-containing protein [Saccharothrix obliqua]|uniref:nucleotide kinase domain-containing protein n=1 Tax=Saccharothrix obliqua TaxID=2861747 RepID=UPI001C5EB13F|nr:nucleotide kinase domain-containing protein [Saccharothrix obliqua]MBW4719794.1 hypothetical protein [Saccharothrix obliqua]
MKIAGRVLRPTTVFDTYWRFAAQRQALYYARARNDPQPWTRDPILSAHRFTNCYRAADRVSQFLIGHVAYPGRQEPTGRHALVDTVFRTLLFKFFNRISTWQLLEDELGPISWKTWHPSAARSVLDRAAAQGQRLYSAAYVIPPPGLGGPRKHHDHLLLLETMIRDGLPAALARATQMESSYHLLRAYRGLGDFLAFQFTIDLNYGVAINFDENDFVVAGPGARGGIRKCFGAAATGIEADIIAYMVDTQEHHFERLGLNFPHLGGRRLHRIDMQNLFCETDKYARIAHPEFTELSGRHRIKQHYRADAAPMPKPFFPPKWAMDTTTLPGGRRTGNATSSFKARESVHVKEG